MQSSHTHCQGIAPSPSPVASEAVVMATPLNVEMPAKSPRNKDRRLVKRLKGLDGLAFSGGNGSTENRDQADGNRAKESEDLKMYHPQVHFHTWNAKNMCFFFLQDERELKRERRKQSNRESARRSRLRKQVLTLSRVEDDAFLCLLDSVLFS
ncbi:hypothetical protein BHE74_00002877 [Ensete ventricosum]|nr:hypothetical protein BHE74_00002877 [Ensete ventricosum]RZR76013.1 hypothetical protein BHM03_00000617 [Ensete ventricosum]